MAARRSGNSSHESVDKLALIQQRRNQYLNSKIADDVYRQERDQFLFDSNSAPSNNTGSSTSSLPAPYQTQPSSNTVGRDDLRRSQVPLQSSTPNQMELNQKTDQLLQQLTSKLTHHIQENLKKEHLSMQLQESEVCDTIIGRIDEFISNELSSFLCPICYELMSPPNRLPILLFPCGHSFCRACLDQHTTNISNSRGPQTKPCPYCR
jgi:hypothetical protein